MARKFLRLVSAFTRLFRDQNGQVVIYFTIMVPVMMGLVGLALEGGRYLMLNSQLQNLADAAALAAAKELNGATGAMTRATAAAEQFSNSDLLRSGNYPWWSNVDNNVLQIQEPLVFYSKLAGVDGALSDQIATGDADAEFVKVTTIDRGVVPAFLVAVGATATNSTRATATAGSTVVACNVQPMMLCNPFEPQGQEFVDKVNDGTVKPGMMFHLKVLGSSTPGGTGNSFAPGDFGLLDPPGLDSSGANTIRNLLSRQNPNFCYINNVSPRTGEAVQKVNDGINVRFDMPANGNQTGLDTSPAPDVIKGLVPKNPNNACNGQYNDLGASARLPRDANWQTFGNLQIGDGTMVSPDSYWQSHYGAGTSWPSDLKAVGQPNRYLAYRRELGLDGQTAPTIVPGTETRDPVCHPLDANESKAFRRIISVAVIDCLANNVRGNAVTNVRSNAYVDFFVTEPSTAGEVWAEFVQLITPSSGGTGALHPIIQLYRDCDPTVTPGCH